MNKLSENINKCRDYIISNGLQEKYRLETPLTDPNLRYLNPFDDKYEGFNISCIDEQSQDKRYLGIDEFMKMYKIK